MKLKSRVVDDVAVLDMSGKLMGGPDADLLATAVQEAIDEGHKNVVANLAEVSWINSTGIGILVRAYTTLKNAGGDLRLANLDKRVESILVVTKLSTVLSSFPSLEEAVGSFG
jgi:anti-sigma B factor antagonist